MTNDFASLGLSPETLRGINAAGFETPTPIQEQAIPILLAGEDLVAQAQTGTGKTAAFALPLVERLDPRAVTPQALILCPTRELAVQVSEAIYALGRPRGFQVLPVYGGQPIDRQLRALRGGVHIVVGTPGRLLDHLRRGTLDLERVTTVILDEADEMLDMGFIEDIEQVLDALPEQRQIALFSATIPDPIARLAEKYLKHPRRVEIAAEPHNVPQIHQSYYEVLPAHKLDALTRILDMETPGPTIIFCGTRREVDELGEHLRGRGYLAESIHGEMSQAERDRAMGRFRHGQVDLLVATDVAARGLDIESVTHVINYDMPWSVDAYTHRIGRTGRAGREGDAITLVCPRERRQLHFIERSTGTRITPVRLPSAADIAARRRELFKQSVVDALNAGDLDQFLVTVGELGEEHDPAEIAAAALKLLWEQRKPMLTTEEEVPVPQPRAEMGMARLAANIGRQDGLRPADLVGIIHAKTGLTDRDIGTIELLDHSAFVEVPRDSADLVRRALSRTPVRGRRLQVEAAPTGRGRPFGKPHRKREGTVERPRPTKPEGTRGAAGPRRAEAPQGAREKRTFQPPWERRSATRKPKLMKGRKQRG